MKQFGEALKNAPKYLVGYIVGLTQALISDIDLTNLGFFGVAVGLATNSPYWGAAAFFGLYANGRAIGTVSDAIAKSLHDYTGIQVQLHNAKMNTLGLTEKEDSDESV